VEKLFASLFPFFFIAMWLTVTTILSVVSGWFRLASQYPNRPEKALYKASFVSGSLGSVSMRGLLKLEACPSGMRIGIFRLFGPFCRDFLVPWREIHVQRTDSFFLGRVAELELGRETKLRLPGYVADQLARAAPGRWPEFGPISVETTSTVFWSLAKRWALLTTFAAAFFVIVPRLMSGGQASVPIAVAIAFPAVVMLINVLPEFFRRTRKI